MVLKVNKKICFFDNSLIVYQQTNKDESTFHERQLFSLKNNMFLDGRGVCSLHPGINSKRGFNDIINSSFYDHKTYIPDLYTKSVVYVTFEENSSFAHNEVFQIVDFMNNRINIVFMTDVDTNNGNTDADGQVIVGLQNKTSSQYASLIRNAVRRYRNLNPEKIFLIDISKTSSNALYLTQSNIDSFLRDTNRVGGIEVNAPSNVIVTTLPQSENSYKVLAHELDFKPFEENKSITKIFSNNPRIYRKTLGIDNLDYEERIYFDDSLTKYSADFYFLKASDVDFPFTFNEKEINSLSTTINPFDTVPILEGKITTEQSLLGIKGHLIYNSIDARNRCNKFKDYQEFIPDRNYNFTKNVSIEKDLDANGKEVIEKSYNIEAFNDEGYEEFNLSLISDNRIEVNFNYTTTNSNGLTHRFIDTSPNASSKITILSNKILYYTDDDMEMVPFFETDFENLNIFIDNVAYSKKNYIYNNFGFQRDEYSSKTPDSITYLGETE